MRPGKNHPSYTCLDDELGAFHARGRGYIKRSAFSGLGAPGQFKNGIGFAVQDFGTGDIFAGFEVPVLAAILETFRRAVVAVRNNPPVLHDQGADFHLPRI